MKVFVALELVPLKSEKIHGHAHKTGTWYHIGDLFQISHQQPRPFYMEIVLVLLDRK